MPPLLKAAAGPLTGTIRVPGDKSVSHRAALFALFASGPCRAAGWLDAADTRSSLAAVCALGCRTGLADGILTVTPPGRPLPPGPDLRLDCGNSGTTARLLMGLLAGWLSPGGPAVVLEGDASLSARPMARVIDPLRTMGARIDCLGEPNRLPVRIMGAFLKGVRHDLPVPSAQVKSALLLAGLFAEGITEVHGGGSSRDHTERLLAVMGVACEPVGADGLRLEGGRRPGTFAIAVPGDPSSAAFFLTAAAMIPGSRLTVTDHALNEGRIGALKVLRRAGATVDLDRARGPREGEMIADVTVTAGSLRPFSITAGEIPTLVDEIPVLAVLATQAAGVSLFSGAQELRVKESDRLAMMARNLQALGAVVEELPDGLRITGPTPLRGGPPGRPLVLETAADHRIAMALAVAALVTEGGLALDDPACVGISYPEFFAVLDGLLAVR